MTATGNPCPRCGHPIHDTAYVCATCTEQLAAELAEASRLWHALTDAVGRGNRTSKTGLPTVPQHTDRRPWHGPWCYGGNECGHESCARAWWAWAHARDEAPIPNETRGLVNHDAAETAWIVQHTAAQWAEHVAEIRKQPIPTPPPPHNRIEPAQQLVHLDDVDQEKPRRRWCVYGDLPIDQCGCGRPHQEEA